MSPHILASFMLALGLASVGAQYYDGYQMATNQQGGYGHGDGGAGGEDERPKIHLGLRVKIPAFKFELPRMQLPKVTISAKIRQPDKPRTIQLPEINLDTSSKVAPPGSKEAGAGDYGGYGSSSSYAGGSSGGGSQTFSFSAGGSEDNHGSSYGNRYQTGGGYQQQRQQAYQPPRNQYRQQYYTQQQPQQYPRQQRQRHQFNSPSYNHRYQQQQQQQQRQVYSAATSTYPSYWQSQSFANALLQPQYTAPPNPDVGFNAPAYVDPSMASTMSSVALASPAQGDSQLGQGEPVPATSSTSAQFRAANYLFAPREYKRTR